MKKGILLLIGVFAIATTSLAQATLKGSLSDEQSGNAIAQATVQLKQYFINVRSVQTDANGNFTLDSLKQGAYDIHISKNGFTEIRITNIQLPAADTIIRLKLKMKSLPILVDSMITEIETDDDIEIEVVENVIYEEEAEEALIAPMVLHSVAGVTNNSGAYHNQLDHSFRPQMNTESYDHIKENTFQNTRSNPLSTFSIDVDRASYANVRRFINQGSMPYKDAVRIEEMINYFDYDYPQPKGKHPFSINMEGGDCPWNPEHKIVHIGLQGEQLQSAEIPPTNLVFLIDVSGSMNSPNKLSLLKQSFHILIDKMRPQDRMAIVVYAGAAGVVLPSTSNKQKIKEALDRLQAGGSTAGGAGIKLAYKIAQENFIEGGNNRIILATDGDFNVGVSNNGELVRMIEKKRESKVFLSILGFGMGNYKDARMEQLSNAGNGNYAYIDNILEAKKVFGKELWGTLYTIAKDVKIQIEFNPAYVQAYRLIGYENRMLENKDFNDDKKDAGEIGSGHSVTAIYEIIPAGSHSKWAPQDTLKYQKTELTNAGSEVCTVKFRYKKPSEDKSILLQEVLKTQALNPRNNSENFRWAMSVAEFGMLLRGSEFKANSTYSSVLQRAKNAKGSDEFGYRAEFIQMVERAQLMDK